MVKIVASVVGVDTMLSAGRAVVEVTGTDEESCLEETGVTLGKVNAVEPRAMRDMDMIWCGVG